MSTFQGPIHDVVFRAEQSGRDDIDVRFEEAERFINAHWAEFDDPSGMAADLAELRVAVSGTHPVNLIRTRLTLHRLRRTVGNAPPVTAVITIVREILDTA